MDEAAAEKKKNVFSAGETDEEKKDRYKAGSIISMVSMLLGGIFQAAWMAAVSRMLGDRKMGLYMPAVSLFYILGNLASLGIPQTITTFVSHHYEKDFDESRKFFSDGIRLLFIISAVTFITTVATAAVLWQAQILSPLMAGMTVVMSASVSAAMVFWGVNGTLNGFQRLDLTSIGNMVFPTGIFGGSVAFIILGRKLAGADSQWDVVGALGGMFVGSFAAFCVSLFVLSRVGKARIASIFTFRGGNGLYGKILRFGPMAAICMVFVTILQQAAPVIVRWVGMKYMLFGNTPALCEAAIGHFSTALFFGQATMLLTGVAIAVMPAISEAESHGRRDMMQHYFSTALHQSFIVLTAFVVVFIAYIGVVIEFMNGPQFNAATMHIPGVLSVIGGAGTSLLFVVMFLFMGLKKPAVPAIVMGLVIVILSIGTAAFSIIFKDINWAYGGFILSAWTGTIILLALAKKMFNLRTELWTFGEPIFAALPGMLLFFFVMPGKTGIWLPVNMAMILGSYGLITWLLDRRRTATEKNAPAEGV